MAGFQKAKRENVYVKILLNGSSGAGKTYSALLLAEGLTKKSGGKIAAIDTENGRIRYYADEFDFDDIQLEAPYTPEKYIEAIDLAVESGYDTLIIDSTSHEWEYLLDVHSKMSGNSYTNWSKITPRHNNFNEKVLQSTIHIIATVRGKDEYALEDKNGKKVPQKIGLGYKQRDGMEYEYTATFNIDQSNHVATVTKDNTHIFEGRFDVLTAKDGEALYEWANSGKSKPQKRNVSKSSNDSELSEIKNSIAKLISEIKEAGVERKIIASTINKCAKTPDYREIDDIKVAKTVYTKLGNLLKEDE